MTVRLGLDVRRAVLNVAAAEARRRAAGRTGTQDLLLATLHDPTSEAISILGTDLGAARTAADRLDRAALASVGVDLGPIELIPSPAGGRRLPLTAGARSTLARAVRLARAERRSRVEMRHLVTALLAAHRPDPAVDVLDELGVDREEARRRANAEI
jgi:ATP-dependent Clp protease ATP-binding subunit ClpA